MLSCGCDPPTGGMICGANWAFRLGEPVSNQTPYGAELESQDAGAGFATLAVWSPPEGNSCTVIEWLCCGVWAVVSVTMGVPMVWPICVLNPPRPLPQCMGTLPCRLGSAKVDTPSPP